MAESFERVLDAPIHLDFGIPRRHHPMLVPDPQHDWEYDRMYHPTDPPIEI